MRGRIYAGGGRLGVLVGAISCVITGALLTLRPSTLAAQPPSSASQAAPPISRGTRGQPWSDSIALAYVEHAIERRGEQLADSTLENYEATAQGFLAFLAQLGEDFIDPPRVVQSEQLALHVAWWQPGRSSQQLVGRRDTTLLPANVGYYRDRYGVVLDNLPDRIRLGDGFDVADVPHPLAQGAEALYEYQRGESFSMRLPDREVMVDEVRFRPRDVTQPRAVGSVYLDRETSAVVRLSLTFTRAAILDRRIETLVVTLENSLVRGRYWLPRRQEVEVVRRSTWLDVPARGIVRGHWEISGYAVNEGLEPLTKLLPPWSSVSRDSLARWTFDGRVVDVLPSDMQVARDDDVKDAQLRAEAAVRAAALARPMTLAAAGRGVSDAIRFSRTEGLALGFGLAHRWPNAVTLSGRVRYGVSDFAPKGRVSLDVRPALGGAPILELFAERQYVELGARERAGVTNSLASLLLGSDYSTPVDTRSLGVAWRPGGARTWSLRGTYDDERSLRVRADPLSGTFAPVLRAWDLEGARLSVERVGRTGVAGERQGAWTLRAIGSQSHGANWFGESVRPRALRVEGDVRMEWPLSNGTMVVASALGGVTVGRDIPPQWLQFAGGPWSGPGYAFHAFAGQYVASPRVEWRVGVPFLPVPLGRYGTAPGRAQLAPYVQAVFLGGAAQEREISRYQEGVYPSAGLGVLLFYDLLRVDVSRGLHRGTWRLAIDIDRAFWGIL